MIDIIGAFSQLGLGWKIHHAYAFSIFVLVFIAPVIILLRRRGQRHFPVAPGALPFIGHALSLANSDEFLTVLTKWAKDIGKDGVYELSLFGQRWIVLCSADTVMQAMRMRSYKVQRASMLTGAVASVGIHGLFNAEGHDWKNDRRLVGPVLNKNNIEDYFEFIKLVSSRLATKWGNEEKEGMAVSALTDLSKYALDISALSILGMDFDSLSNPGHQLANDIRDIFRIIFLRTFSPVPYWKIPFCDNIIDGGRDVAERVMETFRGLVRDYRSCKQQQKEDGMSEEKEQKQQDITRQTFLHTLIAVSDGDDAKLEEERVVGNLAVLVLAGTDTTSTTLAVCLWEIANDRKLQEEVHKEIDESGIDNMDDLTLSDIMNGFPRLYSLLFEVLRVKGPAPFLFLEPGEALDFHGEVLMPGTILCVMPGTLGGKAASSVPTGPRGEGPEEFCPQRWLTSRNNSEQCESLTLIQPSNKFGGYIWAWGAHLSWSSIGKG